MGSTTACPMRFTCLVGCSAAPGEEEFPMPDFTSEGVAEEGGLRPSSKAHDGAPSAPASVAGGA